MIRKEDREKAIQVYTEYFKPITDNEGYISGLIMAKDLAEVLVDSLKPSTTYMVMSFRNIFFDKYKPISNNEVIKYVKSSFLNSIDKLYASIEQKSITLQIEAINEIIFTTNLIIVNAGLHWIVKDLFYNHIEFLKNNDKQKYYTDIKNIVNKNK